MSQALVIVESPAKARTIGGFLGPGYHVLASMGHVRDLPVKSLGVDTEDNFKPQYEVIKGKGKVIRQIRIAAKSSSGIYLAADQDREGEAIGWHVKSILSRSSAPCRRVLFNEITKGAILRAIENPGPLDMDKVDAQQARRVLDRLVGYKVSPYLWRTLKTNLSAGRVQSVSLRLVCEREEEIESFEPQEYWVLKAHLLDPKNNRIEAVLAYKKGKKPRLSSVEEASAAYDELMKKSYVVSKVTTVAKKTRTPAPFITSSLQQEASVRMGFSPDRTMRVAQQLYEGLDVKGEGHVGLITYMRTDSYRISKGAQQDAKDFIRNTWGEEFVPPRTPFYGSKRKTQDAHEAIRPTGVSRAPSKLMNQLTKDQLKLYELIWRRFLASQMAPEKVEITTILIEAGPYTFRAAGVRRVFQGHAVVWPSKKHDEELPKLEKGQTLKLHRLEKTQHFTKPKPRFTEASLIKELEVKGIGRPSTYATILSTLKRRNYVSLEEKRLMPTELGRAVNTILVAHFPELFAVDFTAKLEAKLDMVERGEISWVKVVDDFYEEFKKQLSSAEEAHLETKKMLQRESGEICPVCSRPLLIKFGRHGEFLACSGFPSCRYTQPIKKKSGNAALETPDVACPKCGSFMVVRSGRFGEFLACNRYPECKTTLPLMTGLRCPRAECDGTIVIKRSKGGKRFFGCSKYPECDFVSWNEPSAVLCPDCGAEAAIRKKRAGSEFLSCLGCDRELSDSGKKDSG